MKEKLLVSKLIEKNYKIACCESCTGGLLAATIINVPNASKVIDASYVTYANSEKVRLANVNNESIEKFGVVSEQVAAEMAEGTRLTCGSNVGVGISGIAGPTGATPTKPVGMVCFAFSVEGNIKTFTCHFTGGRNTVRKKSVNFAINKLIEILG